MEAILDFSSPFSVSTFDELMQQFYSPNASTKANAQVILTQFQEHPSAWTRVDAILENSQLDSSKFLALRILENLIQTRWKALPADQREGIKNYVVGVVIKKSQSQDNDAKGQQQKALLNKLNMVLVQILKHEWPHNWPTFIREIVDSSRANLALCENNMVVLKLLSEEIFDFSQEQLTSVKAQELKQQLCSEFAEVFELCKDVLSSGMDEANGATPGDKARRKSLLVVTLKTLLGFLNWIPLGYIFQSDLIELLQNKYLEPLDFRNVTVKCLTEIAALRVGDQYPDQVRRLFSATLATMRNMVPIEKIDLAKIYSTGSSQDVEFIQNLALFVSTLLNSHLKEFESDEYRELLMYAHFLLIEICKVDDREVFKVCLEYWHSLVSQLFNELQSMYDSRGSTGAFVTASMSSPGALQDFLQIPSGRRTVYADVLSRLRVAIIEKMVRPEEVLIVENEEGEVVREIVRESDTISLYKQEKEVLVYLTLLDVKDTERIMSEKLERQVDGSEWSWQNLNRLCWAIGSISGAMSEDVEKQFLVSVIKELLGLVEVSRGKDNKAIIASDIMYVVGQYPRFLKAHWRFLKTVVNKLFEFMHERHEGVQDMACDTFIKIAQRCRRHFILPQAGEQGPYVSEVLDSLPMIIPLLSPQQTHTCYEAIGYMISAHPDKVAQEQLIGKLLEMPNLAWDNAMQAAERGTQDLLGNELDVKILANVLKTMVASCIGCAGGSPPTTFTARAGPKSGSDGSTTNGVGGMVSSGFNGSSSFYKQIGRNFLDNLGLYRASSELISSAVAQDPKVAPKTPRVRAYRTIKKETLRLMETFVVRVEYENYLNLVNEHMVPPLFEAVLMDYQKNVEPAREAEVLSMICAVVSRLKSMLNDNVQAILNAVFSCTLQMISRNFTDFPDHRLNFYKLMKAINDFCFEGLLSVNETSFKLFIDSLVWGFKHPQRDIAEMSLGMLQTAFTQLTPGLEATNAFYRRFYLLLLNEILAVLTDSEHKSGFKSQCLVLAAMVRLVEEGVISVPLFDPTDLPPSISAEIPSPDALTNALFIKLHLRDLLSASFKHLTRVQIESMVEGLFTHYRDHQRFKSHVRDFLIELKQFSVDPQALYADEREAEVNRRLEEEQNARLRIPGMVRPSDRPEDEAQS